MTGEVAAATRSGRDGGSTLVEIMVVVTLMTPLLAAVASSTRAVSGDISTSTSRADARQSIRTLEQRLSKLARPGLLSTCRNRATQADVDYYTANMLMPVPAVGDWISPRAGQRRPSFQFRAALGGYSFMAASVSAPHSFEFVLDPGETANGADDDGDGLVDEGSLVHDDDGTSLVLATGVERCEFWLEGQVLNCVLTCARRDHGGRVHRQTAELRTTMRNN